VQEILVVQSTRIGVELLRRRPDRSWPEEPEGTDARERCGWRLSISLVPCWSFTWGRI
jgi:hypothetical protein